MDLEGWSLRGGSGGAESEGWSLRGGSDLEGRSLRGGSGGAESLWSILCDILL